MQGCRCRYKYASRHDEQSLVKVKLMNRMPHLCFCAQKDPGQTLGSGRSDGDRVRSRPCRHTCVQNGQSFCGGTGTISARTFTLPTAVTWSEVDPAQLRRCSTNEHTLRTYFDKLPLQRAASRAYVRGSTP